MRSCPSERLLLGVEKTIDDDGIALRHISPTRARSFAIDHARPTVYSYTFRISKDNFAAIGNFLWVERNALRAAVRRSKRHARPNLPHASKR